MFEQRLVQFKRAIDRADAVIIGAGAGFSAAAGLTYSGERFEHNFAEYIARYGMTDMYSAGFYPFDTEQEMWGYWSRHISINRHQPAALPLYLQLKALIGDKANFVITTNVDYQFYKSGFDSEHIFAVQGDYGKLQCAQPCHQNLYENEPLIASMLAEQQACRIPKALIPQCPNCGGPMAVNIRKDNRFVEDSSWHRTAEAYQAFVSDRFDQQLLLLELGVGYNTPSIIKYPFERITEQAPQATLVRINRDYPEVSDVNRSKTIVFKEDISDIFSGLGV